MLINKSKGMFAGNSLLDGLPKVFPIFRNLSRVFSSIFVNPLNGFCIFSLHSRFCTSSIRAPLSGFTLSMES